MTTIVARRAAIVAVVAGLLFVLLGTAPVGYETRRSESTAVSAADSHPSLPVVGRTFAATRFAAAARAIKQRGIALDALAIAASAAAMFARFRRRTNEVTAHRLRFEAVFALRRGPPIFHPAH